MREGIGSIALYNIIIIFIAVTFSVLAGTMSYSKAFKVNNRIINAIEKYEGYNQLAADKIDDKLMEIGYQLGYSGCSKRRGYDPLENFNKNYTYCVYQYPEETREWNGRYSTYGVVSYINLDFPVVGEFFKIPVYGRSNMVFRFGDEAPIQESKITKSLSVHLSDYAMENYVDKVTTGRLTFYQNESVSIRELFDIYVVSSDGISFEVDDYYVSFSTQNIGSMQYLEISWGELTASWAYDVVARG